MKTLIPIIGMGIVLTLYSCTSSPEDKAIGDFVQTIGDTKTDMKFKLLSKETTQEIKASDSINFWKEKFKLTDSKALLDTIKVRFNEREELIKKWEAEGEGIGSYAKEKLHEFKQARPIFQSLIPSMESYISDESKVICQKIKCTYSIENPLLNNAKQELTRNFYYSVAKKKVYSSDK